MAWYPNEAPSLSPNGRMEAFLEENGIVSTFDTSNHPALYTRNLAIDPRNAQMFFYGEVDRFISSYPFRDKIGIEEQRVQQSFQ